MANGKDLPILITCACGLAPTLNFVSAGQTCEPRNCGESACGQGFDDITGEGGDTSTGPCPCGEGYTTYLPANCKTYESYSSSPVQLADCFPQICYKCTEYDDEACATIKTVVSPKCTNLAQRCRNRAYKRIVTKDTSGDQNHGRITTRQYSINAKGECVSETTCSGTSIVVNEYESSCDYGLGSGSAGTISGSANKTTTTTTTWNDDCSSSSETTCSGSSNSTSTGAGEGAITTTCTSTYTEDCVWEGEYTLTNVNPPITSPYNDDCCKNAASTTKTTITPTPDCTVTVTYSDPDTEKICTPKSLPSYPAFIKCDTEPPALQPGQGYSNSAYKYVDLYEPLRTNEQKIKYRVEHPPIFPACYLKVWVTKVTQKWRQESCGNPLSPCCLRWEKDGQPIKTDEPAYIWTPESCDYDLEEDLSQCEHVIYGTEREALPGNNESIHIELKKYSYVKDYEPEDPDENGNQPCRPNGWPLIKC